MKKMITFMMILGLYSLNYSMQEKEVEQNRLARIFQQVEEVRKKNYNKEKYPHRTSGTQPIGIYEYMARQGQ